MTRRLAGRLRSCAFPASAGTASLIEVLIVLVIFAGLAMVIFMCSLVSNRSYIISTAFAHVHDEARRALNAMVSELREAGGTVTAAGSQLDFQVALGYALGGACPTNDVCWGAQDQTGTVQGGWSIRYRLNGTQLLREILDGGGTVQAGTRVLANNVSQLSFAYTGGSVRMVTVQLQVEETSGQLAGGKMGTSPSTVTTQVRLRNS